MKKAWIILVTVVIALTMITPIHVNASETTYVAAIGDVEYMTLQEAVAMAEPYTETKITLLDDIVMDTEDIVTISADKVISLDMAQHSITVNRQFVGRPIVNEGTLKVDGNGVIDSSNADEGYGAINNLGTLTIWNGTYRGNKYAEGSVIRNTGINANLEIMDGLFENATCAIYNEGNVVIHGGIFKSDTCSQCNKQIWSYTIRNTTVASKMIINGGEFYGVQGAVSASNGYLEINDGYFKTEKCHDNEYHTATFYALYVAGEDGPVELIVNGGTFETEGTHAAVLVGNDNLGGDGGINEKASATINDGTFIAPEGVATLKVATNTGDLIIYAGQFTSEPEAHDISEQSNMIEDNGYYIVYPKVTSIAFQEPSIELAVGDSISLLYHIYPSNTLDTIVSFSSDHEDVATVEETGVLKAIKEGMAIITITTSNGLTDTMQVHVYQNYTVVFRDDETILSQATIRKNELVSKPKDPQKTGYQFIGWYQGEQMFDFATPITSDVELVAKWKHVDGNYHIVSGAMEPSILPNGITAYFTLDTLSETIIKASMTNELQQLIETYLAKGKDVTTEVMMEPLDETVNGIWSNDIALAAAFAKQQQLNMIQYLNVHIQVVCEQTLLGEITATTAPLKFHIIIPEEWQKEGRTFFVIRVHDNALTLLDTVATDGTLSFETDKFSLYALAYQDEITANPDLEKDQDATMDNTSQPKADDEETQDLTLNELPKTGDSSMLMAYSLLTILCMMVLGLLHIKYRLQKNQR